MSKYQIGTAVEVEAWDSRTRSVGFIPGVVEAVEVFEDGLRDVRVRTVDGAAKVVRVGKRGGCRQLRAA